MPEIAEVPDFSCELNRLFSKTTGCISSSIRVSLEFLDCQTMHLVPRNKFSMVQPIQKLNNGPIRL